MRDDIAWERRRPACRLKEAGGQPAGFAHRLYRFVVDINEMLPSGGVSLKACSFRSVDLAGIFIPVFIARGCSFDSCNFTGTRFGAGS